MKIENVHLTKIKLNKLNPRIIKEDKFEKLVNSILAFPKMLEIRPIVVNKKYVALGGNMRSNALEYISKMSIEDIKDRLLYIKDWMQYPPENQEAVIRYWQDWKQNPTAPIIKVDELTEAEQQQFIIKDNVGFGEWDHDMLAANWDVDDLQNWGLDLPVFDTDDDEPEDLSEKIQDEFKIEVSLESEEEQEKLFNELEERGYTCRILTL